MHLKQSLLNDPDVWGAVIAAKFAQAIGLPAGNFWEPAIARTLARHVIDGTHTRDEIELLMALQLGIAQHRKEVRP